MLKSISIAVNHCVALLRSTLCCVNLQCRKIYKLFRRIMLTWLSLTLLFCKTLLISNLIFLKKELVPYLTSVYLAKSVLIKVIESNIEKQWCCGTSWRLCRVTIPYKLFSMIKWLFNNVSSWNFHNWQNISCFICPTKYKGIA